MRTFYLDSEFVCHTQEPEGSYTTVETDIFDGKCDEYANGYRYIPTGESWTREDGTVFHGEMLAPVTDFSALDAAQRAYEQAQLEDMRSALAILGVSVDG